MARDPRYVPPGGALVEVTYRTVQGRFLLRPGQALNELLVGVVGHAQSLYPVELIGIVVLSNHLHLLMWVESQYQLTGFMRLFGGNSEAFAIFVAAFREASELLRKGVLDAPFPEGCFPPGLPYVGDTGGLPLRPEPA